MPTVTKPNRSPLEFRGVTRTKHYDDNRGSAAIMPSRYKTRMCQNFEVKGSCPYEVRCMFAHGDAELRTKEMNLDEGITTEDAIQEHRRKLEYQTQAASSSNLKRLNSGLNNSRKGEKKGSPIYHHAVEPSKPEPVDSISLCQVLPEVCVATTPKNHSPSATPNTSMNNSMNGLSALESCLAMENQTSGFDLSPHSADAYQMECDNSTTSSSSAPFQPTLDEPQQYGGNNLRFVAPHIRKLTRQELAQGSYTHSPYAKWDYNAECECPECVETLV